MGRSLQRWLALVLAVASCSSSFGGASGAENRPVVVLVSIDGFRWDYFDRPGAESLRRIAETGVRARTMEPVFPSKTFPNNYTQVTGLYPEHHGIVSNTMEDSLLGSFSLGNRAAVTDARWWGGEPIWVTARRAGLRSATYFWPGSEAPIGGTLPDEWKQFDDGVPHETRVQWVLDALARSPDSVPSFISIYFSQVDNAGHGFGPESGETDSAIASVDRAVGMLWDGIHRLGMEGRVNLVVVSDHGMAALAPERLIVLDDYLEPGSYRLVDRTPVAALRPEAGKEDEIVARLGAVPNLQVFRRAEMPERFHYRGNDRIQPVLAVAAPGWQITTRARARGSAALRGDHGYDHTAPDMGALFIAAGPGVAQGRVVDRVRALDVYELMCALLGIQPAPNDGALDSIRVVLRAEG